MVFLLPFADRQSTAWCNAAVSDYSSGLVGSSLLASWPRNFIGKVSSVSNSAPRENNCPRGHMQLPWVKVTQGAMCHMPFP